MRTTIDLEDDLLRDAKVEAIRRGVTLRELIAISLEKELGKTGDFVPEERRVQFPLFPAKTSKPLVITNEVIKALEEEEDLRQWKLAHGELPS